MPPDCPASVVLDTNVVLDWLVFGDPAAVAIGRQITALALLWRASSAMQIEFEHVVQRPALARWTPDATALAAAWRAHARIEVEPPSSALICADTDDQVFIDLALEHRCRRLVTRDRALLALRHQAAAWGVSVLTPQQWLSKTQCEDATTQP